VHKVEDALKTLLTSNPQLKEDLIKDDVQLITKIQHNAEPSLKQLLKLKDNLFITDHTGLLWQKHSNCLKSIQFNCGLE